MKKEIISFPNSKYNVHTWKDVSFILMLLTNLAQNLKIYSRWSDSYWTDKEINELWLSLSCFLRIPADAKLVGRDAIICQLFVLQFSFNFFHKHLKIKSFFILLWMMKLPYISQISTKLVYLLWKQEGPY